MRTGKVTVYFDMDGTLFNLYGVDNWLEKLQAEDNSPYLEAEPLIDFIKFGKLIGEMQEKGIEVGIISWLAKNSTREYKAKVRKAKRKSLEKIPVKFDVVHLVQYGTEKQRVAKNQNYRIIFDDDDTVLRNWEKGKSQKIGIDVKKKNIIEELQKILDRF